MQEGFYRCLQNKADDTSKLWVGEEIKLKID